MRIGFDGDCAVCTWQIGIRMEDQAARRLSWIPYARTFWPTKRPVGYVLLLSFNFMYTMDF